jgi:hypothetical protein
MHAYTNLGERLKLVNDYEKHMHRTYQLDGNPFHAMNLVFMQSGKPYVAGCSTHVYKDRTIISLEDFDTLLKGENEDAKPV